MKTKHRNNLTNTIIFLICIGIIIFTAPKLFSLIKGYKKSSNDYSKIRKTFTESQTDKNEKISTNFEIDFESLTVANPDTIGWIKFDKPEEINYPLLHCDNNEKYLHAGFDGSYNRCGSIFMDSRNSSDFSDKNSIIYGHNMWDKTMFSKLALYENKKFFKENPNFYIYLPTGNKMICHVFAAAIVDENSDIYDMIFDESPDNSNFIDAIEDIQLYDTDTKISKNSKLVTLSTCRKDDREKRFILVSVLTNENN